MNKIKIKGKVKVYFSEGTHSDSIKMKVKFKLPNNFMYVCKTVTITSSWWILSDGYKNMDEFWEDSINKLSNKEYLTKMAKSVIIDYLDHKYKNTTSDKNKRKVLKLIEDVKSFDVEVEYEK